LQNYHKNGILVATAAYGCNDAHTESCRWAYEAKNEEIIDLLRAAGVDEEAKDRGLFSFASF
jgi:hypothetical protein